MASWPLPGRTSVERCLVRHGLVTPQARKRKRSDYKRWERSRSMELWQMDIVGGVRLVDGSEAKIVSGIDDHSRFVVSARVVARATARPVCDALAWAMAAHGVPEQILTDNGKVFTARFGPGPGPVRFDRICVDNGIRHLLTAPRSPTTTGKVERWHKTLRREFLDGKVFASIDDAQAQLDAWVRHYNHERPHQSIGRVPPIERFQLAAPRPGPAETVEPEPAGAASPVTTRRVSATGHDQLRHRAATRPGAWLAGQTVEVVCDGGLVQLHHRGVLIATHARRHPIDKQTAGARSAAAGCGRRAQVGDGGVGDPQGRLVRQRVLRRHQLPGRHRSTGAARSKSPSSATPSRSRSATSSSAPTASKHDRTREHGALANPGGRPHRINAA